ncbi:MAG TPA: hypothetical protein DD473_27705 [Planctomycetaceae bacterium]|nr:hypothetical protein [Planctomycetaceae bacterium]
MWEMKPVLSPLQLSGRLPQDDTNLIWAGNLRRDSAHRDKDVMAMTKLISLFAGILIGGVLVYTGFNYHIVKTDQTTYMISKQKSELADVYVDIRDWDYQTWAKHPNLAQAMTEAGHGDLVQKSLAEDVLDTIFRKIGGTEQRTRK